jgi:hypothetical protein
MRVAAASGGQRMMLEFKCSHFIIGNLTFGAFRERCRVGFQIQRIDSAEVFAQSYEAAVLATGPHFSQSVLIAPILF